MNYSEAELASALSPWMEEQHAPNRESRFVGRVETAPLWDRLSDISRALLTANGQPDRSAHIARVVEQLHFEGYALDEIVSLCCDRPGVWAEKHDTDARLIRDIERCFGKFAVPKDAESRANDEAARRFAQSSRESAQGISGGAHPIKATPFVYQDPSTLPRRDVLYGNHYNRKYVGATFGTGGGNKSGLAIADALAMVSGKATVGYQPAKALRVWYFNLEDPPDELQRRFVAAAMHHGIDPKLLNQNLFVDSGRDQSLVVLRQEGRETRVVEPVVESLIAEMKKRQIDVLIVDPFVSTHEVDENDNNKIQQVANQFVRIANEANAAVELVHHVNKSSGDGKGEVNAESGRGAGALKDKARSVRALNTMSADEAAKAGIDPEDRFAYFRVTNAKSNMAKRTGHADWRRVVSVELGNGESETPGDSVGVVEKWDWPSDTSIADQISPDLLRAVKAEIALGQYGENPQASDWAGKVFARVLDLNLMSAQDRHKIARIMRGLIQAGHFAVVKRSDKSKGRDRPMFEVASLPHPGSGGVGMTVH